MMDDSIDWKEARCGQSDTDSENDDELNREAADNGESEEEGEEFKSDHEDAGVDEIVESEQETFVGHQTSSSGPFKEASNRLGKKFSFQRLNLSLRRNIIALADSNQHQSKTNYNSDSQTTEAFDGWVTNALVSISPNADLILFAGQSPEKVAFLAKLRIEPIDQYIIKPLEIPLDYNEQITSLLCLPIMSNQKTARGLVDWTALVIGLSSGYVKFYTEQSVCLLSLKFSDEPVISIKCQTQKNNSNSRSETHFAIVVDEILVAHKSSAIIIDGLGLYENLRISKEEVVRSGSNYEPAYDLTNLPCILNCQKWKIPHSQTKSLILDAEILGTRRTTTFDALKSDSINFDNNSTKACTRTIAFVGSDPFISCYKESKDATTHTYTELIGSLFSIWNKPQPTRTHFSEVHQPNNISLFDQDRLATSIVSSPDKRLAAVTDDFGRVLLVDVTNWLIIRIWKGYRSAQCGWIEVKRSLEKRNSPQASFLVIYAPKRGLLEVWSAQKGPRVAAFNVGKSCRLLYSGYKMLNMRTETHSNINSFVEQSYSSHCYLLNAKSETIFSIEVPYTYSLYKYGDLKSRDQLLIGELNNAMQHDSEIEIISEILHRIALAQSLQTSIERIASGLSPKEIVPIMENLINKTMKNYDNLSGETMTEDDKSIIELCKRLIRLCVIFKDLSELIPHDLSLPDVNQRLIDHYEEHPQEVDEFAEQLGWSTSEVLRYLSLLSLERSYREKHLSNPWPSLGEPLYWAEFVSCFDLRRIDNQSKNGTTQHNDPDKISIRLKEFNSKFLGEDKVIKTALFMYNRLSETYYKSIATKQPRDVVMSQINNNYNYIEPSSRLALLFQFWLSTKLCSHWKMWAFLQNQVGCISDELKVISMGQKDDNILVQTWQQVYNLILESDNIFAGIIATASIKSDTLKMIQDNEKREKLDREDQDSESDNVESPTRSSVDWECLCIDAERMSMLSQQLEDVFLLNLLLKYSIKDGHLVESYVYRIPRISVANILRSGPTVVSELVAQWAVQSNVNLKIFTQPYGTREEDEVYISGPSANRERSKLFAARQSHLDNEESAKELLHHTKTCYQCSLDSNVVFLNCVWEFCRKWASNLTSIDKVELLKRAYRCLSLFTSVDLRHKISSLAYKTFFQRTFNRLVIIVETNTTILSVKSYRIRDTLTRKELNMSDECLEDFVQFCCDLSEFMLQTCMQNDHSNSEDEDELRERLLSQDNWWPSSRAPEGQQFKGTRRRCSLESSSCDDQQSNSTTNSLARIVLFSTNLFNINFLVELNRLANLMNLIFKLKIVKVYPMSLIGEESRQILQIDLQQSPVSGTILDVNNRSGPLNELRQKFARKCILSVVCKMADEMNDFDDEMEEDSESKKEGIDFNRQPVTNQRNKPTVATTMKSKSGKQVATTGDISTSSDRLVKPIKDNGNIDLGIVDAEGERDASNSSLLDDDYDDGSSSCNKMFMRDENNEYMVLFTNLLSLANEWQLNCDELYLELVFELYRCNLDKIASQISTRILDQQTLANGLLKICSQRILLLFGLSPQLSGSDWRRRGDKWSIFPPNVSSWLKMIQQEEMKREIASLSFVDSLKTQSTPDFKTDFGVEMFVLHSLRKRTRLVLESVTNHLDGQAGRLAYDLLQLLESQLFDKFLRAESKLSA